jgi:hypothetical protein
MASAAATTAALLLHLELLLLFSLSTAQPGESTFLLSFLTRLVLYLGMKDWRRFT